jgi:hypothetical protein
MRDVFISALYVLLLDVDCVHGSSSHVHVIILCVLWSSYVYVWSS